MGYSNFRDPVGLLRRMLLSGDRTAYFTLFREGLSVAMRPLDALLTRSEAKRMAADPGPSSYPVLLVLGGSRSGTTLLYQTLTKFLPVSYFNNLSASFPRAPITAAKKFNKFLPRQRADFRNYYGSVSGLNGPNDGFHIWNRWLGPDRNNIPDEISPAALDDMRRFFHAWFAAFPAPFVNKNNRNSLCVPLFESALDHVCYVEITRDPIYVAQSLVRSRAVVQGDKRAAWGLASRDSEPSDDPLGYIDDICQQIFDVEQRLAAASSLVSPERYLRISYEAFCGNPAGVVSAVGRQLLGAAAAPDSLTGLQPFKNTNEQTIGDIEFSRIVERTAELRRATPADTSGSK